MGDRNFHWPGGDRGFGIASFLRLSVEFVLHPDRPLRAVAFGLQRVLLDQMRWPSSDVAADRTAGRARFGLRSVVRVAVTGYASTMVVLFAVWRRASTGSM